VNHLAIDLGSRESQVCIRTADGTIVDERKYFTRKLEALLQAQSPSRVIVETSAEAFRIADLALGCGHEVRVVPATLVKTLGVGSRGVKNDEKDARVLSEVSTRIDLPSVHIPSMEARNLRSISGSRELLTQLRTKAVNCVRGWMRTHLWRLRSGSLATFPERVRAHAQAQTAPLPEHIERLLVTTDTLNEQVKAADRQLLQIAKAHPVCRLLMTMPGVGPVTAVRFVAAIDRVDRFRGAHALQSYLGLTPGQNSSSERKRLTSITKAGPSALRWALIQGAWAAWRSRPLDPMVRWTQQIADRRGKFIAIVALARKMAGILFAMWRDQTPYRATAAVTPVSPV
jgi:transposase